MLKNHFSIGDVSAPSSLGKPKNKNDPICWVNIRQLWDPKEGGV